MNTLSRHKLIFQIFLIFSISFLSTSCAVVIGKGVKSGVIKGSLLSDKDNTRAVSVIAKKNETAIQFYKDEWQYNRTDKKLSPKLCLAMSGGGIRSAAFNIGVLQGLHEKGLLQKIDVLSAVSGGTHALSWYYVQLFKYFSDYRLTDELANQLGLALSQPLSAELTNDQVFSKSSELAKFLRTRLGDNAVKNKQELVSLYGRYVNDKTTLFSPQYLTHLSKKSAMYSFAELMSTALINIGMAPVNFLVNGIFSGNINTTSQRAYYQHSVKRTFYSKVGGHLLDKDLLIGENISFRQMDAFIKTNKLPYFIINTSANIDNDSNNYGGYLKNSVFEFTPLRLGSNGYGYSDNQNYSVSLAVSISSAALDSTVIPGKMKSLMGSTLNMDLGYYIPNYYPELPSANWQLIRRLTPFPFNYLWKNDAYRRDQLGLDIYLTDGGHTENLATYSLVRRACEHIIIVDAEYDPDYKFASYRKLKNALLREMQLELDVPGLINDFDTNDNVFKENRDAIVTGEIRNIIRQKKNTGTYLQKTKITYIKLSVKNKLLKKIEKVSRLFRAETKTSEIKNNDAKLFLDYAKNYCAKTGWIYKRIFGCEFPHYTTIDQSYTSEQFHAYTYLGYSIIKHSENI